MEEFLIMMPNETLSYKGQQTLYQAKIKSEVVKRPSRGGGCGFALQIAGKDREKAISRLQAVGLPTGTVIASGRERQ